MFLLFTFYTNYLKSIFPMNIVIGKDNSNNKFKKANNIDFLFMDDIKPIIPSIGHIKIVLIPKGFNSVNLFNKSTGRIYEITNIIMPSTNVYFSIFFSILLALQY